MLPEAKGDVTRIDDIEANIQALAQLLGTQVGELLSWMETFDWERHGKHRFFRSTGTAVVELERKMKANEWVKDDFKAV